MSKYGVPVNFRDWGKTRREITTTTTNNGGVVSDMLPQTATPPHGRRGPPSTSPANTPLPPRRCSPHSSSSSSTTSPSRLRTWAKVGPTSGAQPVESPPRDRCGKVPGGQGREPRGGSRRRSRIGNREAVPRGRDGIGDTTAGIASHAGGEEGAPRPVGRGYVPSRRRAGFR